MAHPLLFCGTLLLHAAMIAGVYDWSARFYHWCRTTTFLQLDAQRCRAVVVTIVACCLLLTVMSLGAPMSPETMPQVGRLVLFLAVTASGALNLSKKVYPLVCQDWAERMKDLTDDCGCKKD